MSTQVQYRRGTATENNAFTGALAEITVDTTNWTLRVHDGVTAGGGGNIATVAYVTAQLAALSANAITFGTSNVQIPSSGSNVRINVGGTSNVAVFSTAGANITGTLGVTGNITGSFILGNGSQLTGIDATSIQSGTSNVRVVSAGGDVTVGVAGTSNVAVFGTTGLTVAGNITGGNLNTAGIVSATGNISGGNLLVTGNIVDSAALSILSGSNGNIALIPNGTGIVTVSTALSVAGNINTSGANGVANIGAVGAFFNTVHARATSAQYADLAEYYAGDKNYSPGTVLVFGGTSEVTQSVSTADPAVAGVVSTNPAYIMNAGILSAHAVAVALTGRVPTKVIGPVRKGNMMVSAPGGYAQACTSPAVGTVIGKAIENFDGEHGIIEIVVGRL